jgi:hypothetical protein
MKLKYDKSIIIASFNSDLNDEYRKFSTSKDVDHVPMILFYKAGEDKNPIVYKGSRDKAEILINFIRKNQVEVKVTKLPTPNVIHHTMIINHWLGLFCER